MPIKHFSSTMISCFLEPQRCLTPPLVCVFAAPQLKGFLASLQEESTVFANVDNLAKMNAVFPTLGLKWQDVGDRQPEGGSKLSSGVLEKSLAAKTASKKYEFTSREWDAMGITGLQVDNYVEVGGRYFKPVATRWTSVDPRDKRFTNVNGYSFQTDGGKPSRNLDLPGDGTAGKYGTELVVNRTVHTR